MIKQYIMFVSLFFIFSVLLIHEAEFENNSPCSKRAGDWERICKTNGIEKLSLSSERAFGHLSRRFTKFLCYWLKGKDIVHF